MSDDELPKLELIRASDLIKKMDPKLISVLEKAVKELNEKYNPYKDQLCDKDKK